ncbi:hypothetical protein L873DRAFT_1799543 [Choiromyces venosus 120613-1]|uniref:Uncharacterized protein n=1 Tax=Choiromyces venosus 120613-1 TaxID=1336337 RepID=A0A3N4K0N0_9PEZI|nr:hypothetical protein L873DRAFT_1799543 [Choiromyces venosus 120613-1]
MFRFFVPVTCTRPTDIYTQKLPTLLRNGPKGEWTTPIKVRMLTLLDMGGLMSNWCSSSNS